MLAIIITVIILVVLLLLFAGTKFIMFFMRKVANKKLNLGKAFIYFSSFSFLALFGDFLLSSAVFQYYCSDKEFVGQHIYERVALTDDMFLSPPDTDKERTTIDVTLLINNESKWIDGKKFNAVYDYQFSKRTTLFPIGPVFKTETTVKRKADGKLLGKSVSLTNKKGWLHELDLLWLNTGAKCPVYKSEQGLNLGNSDHSTLINNIFYRK